MENPNRLGGPLLRSVSRSFYLSIRLLPAALRAPIGLAYLLARATDTIADTADVSVELRLRALDELAARIQGSGARDDSLSEFVARQKNGDERRLLEALPDILAWLAQMPEADRADIRAVLLQINEGQRLDLLRPKLQSAEELERYTYLVAGCVGEFWTRTCLRHLPRFASLPDEKMHSLGVEYGKGLQLINILRDQCADRSLGRNYLPEDARPFWLERAQAGMSAGIEYACAIRNFRVRLATALPALIGARTLELLRAAGPEALRRKIKIPRAEVRRILFRTIASFASPKTLRAIFSDSEKTSAASP